MSSLTDEWFLKTQDNCIKYIMDIKSFDRKVKTFRVGREIHSKRFKIGSATFQVEIYPGGSEDGDWVGIFLRNLSNWRVQAKCRFSIPNTDFEYDLGKDYYQRNGNWGTDRCFHWTRCTTDDLLTRGGVLTLQADIEILEEEVHPDRDLTLDDATEDLRKTVNFQTSQINLLQEKMDKSETQTKELKEMVKELLVGRNSKQPTQVECPVCMEVVRPPMRLKQCGQGHIICDSCHARTQTEATGREGDLCHTCRRIITGRPSQLEKILGLC